MVEYSFRDIYHSKNQILPQFLIQQQSALSQMIFQLLFSDNVVLRSNIKYMYPEFVYFKKNISFVNHCKHFQKWHVKKTYSAAILKIDKDRIGYDIGCTIHDRNTKVKLYPILSYPASCSQSDKYKFHSGFAKRKLI